MNVSHYIILSILLCQVCMNVMIQVIGFLRMTISEPSYSVRVCKLERRKGYISSISIGKDWIMVI